MVQKLRVLGFRVLGLELGLWFQDLGRVQDSGFIKEITSLELRVDGYA